MKPAKITPYNSGNKRPRITQVFINDEQIDIVQDSLTLRQRGGGQRTFMSHGNHDDFYVQGKPLSLNVNFATEYDPKKHILRKQMMEVWGVSNNGAGYRLDKLVSDGKLKVEKVRLPDGNTCNGYYKPQ